MVSGPAVKKVMTKSSRLSVKASNAQQIFSMADVDGGLIGGASLKADEFLKICAAAQIH